MSLTSFIKEPDVKAHFSKTFPLPDVDIPSEVRAPPITANYSLVGTAFDYLLRFYVKRKNPSAKTSEWVAESAISRMEDVQLKSKLAKRIAEAKKNYSDYLKEGCLSEPIIRTAIYLAKIDPIYRANYIDSKLDSIDAGDVQDLKNLINLVAESQFSSKKLCVLNPTFGNASNLVGGADADLIIDSNLIDIKTTKFIRLKEQDYHQLVGYYILSNIGDVDGVGKVKIDKLSLYFSRGGTFLSLNTRTSKSSILHISNKEFREFVKWFIHRASNPPQSRL